MRIHTEPFDLRSWRLRQGWTQERAAHELGYSLQAYRAAEYRAMDRVGQPCDRTTARLARILEAGGLVA